jgi:hypothetical protein
MFQFEGLSSSASLAAMSVVTNNSVAEDLPQETDEKAYIRCLEELLRDALDQNNELVSKLANNAIAQLMIPRIIFVRIYPIGKLLLRHIIAMTQHLVLQDTTFQRRPGVRLSVYNTELITKYANEAIIRVTRGHATNGPINEYDHGKLCNVCMQMAY